MSGCDYDDINPAAHAHAFTPVPGEVGQYACTCGQAGYRAFSGEIREHRTKKTRSPTPTARPFTERAGRIPRDPEDY